MKINVTRSSIPPLAEYIDDIRELWDTRWLTNMGIKHKTLETMLKEHLGVNSLSLTSSGHLALEICLQAFELKGEVITTPFTFASTTHAIVRMGLTPIFCDIDHETYVIDANKIESMITEHTCAILPVHVYGNMCDVEKIADIAERYNLKVIYDAAHAFGVKYKGKGVGTFGDASMFSFHATKVFNTIEGGAVCSSDPEIITRIAMLKNFGITKQDTVGYIGTNAKMNEFCAAMGICNLRHINEEIAKRKFIFHAYSTRLSDVIGLSIPSIQPHTVPNYAYYPIIINEREFGIDRDELAAALAEKNIFVRKYFYPLTNSFGCYKDLYSAEDTPVAHNISQRVLALPIYADLTEGDVDRVCDAIIAARKQRFL